MAKTKQGVRTEREGLVVKVVGDGSEEAVGGRNSDYSAEVRKAIEAAMHNAYLDLDCEMFNNNYRGSSRFELIFREVRE